MTNAVAGVVVVEDDATIRAILQMTLKNAGFTNVQTAADGLAGLELVTRLRPALVLLDVMLPGLDGFSICRRIREMPELADVRIVMLTARGEDADVVKGLELGADDYVAKPFSRSVLTARINAVLRRQDPFAGGKTLDGLALGDDFARLDGKDLGLTRAEFRLLSLLASHPGRVYTRARIIDATQTEDRAVTERAVDFLVVGLRKKLGDWAPHLETIRGVGYRVSRQPEA